MDTIGFIFGISGMSFGLLGFIFGMSASNNANSAVGKIEQLERQLSDAGVIKREDA